MKKLRIRYKITYLSDTEIIFEVLYLDTKNLKDPCVINGNWWTCVPGIQHNGASICEKLEMIFLQTEKPLVASRFKNKKQRDETILLLKKLLNVWKYKAYGI